MNTVFTNGNVFHNSGLKSDFQKNLPALETKLTLLLFSFSFARLKTKAEPPNIHQ